MQPKLIKVRTRKKKFAKRNIFSSNTKKHWTSRALYIDGEINKMVTLNYILILIKTTLASGIDVGKGINDLEKKGIKYKCSM